MTNIPLVTLPWMVGWSMQMVERVSGNVRPRISYNPCRKRSGNTAFQIELSEKKWVKAVVEHIPEHERFVQFRLHFVNMFGQHTSYTEAFTMNELAKMMASGELVRA